jgi:hypothetical protein
VGLHLYADKADKKSTDHSDNKPKDNPKGGNGGNGSNGNGNGRLTAKQHGFLMRLANERGLTRKELNDQCVETYGSVVDYLTRQSASAMIENMMAQ